MAKDGLCVLGVAALVLAGALLSAAPVQGARASYSSAGQMYYMRYCATCHGKEGKGNGPLSTQLKKPASDLTTLSKTHGGKFPYNEVLGILDGEEPFPAHGSAEMPAWGDTFQADVGTGGGDAAAEAAVRGRLMLITDYLRSIQQK
jgi:mono/diheme cytochrome c family protein